MTLINVAVTITLFIILISGVYALLRFSSQQGSDYMLKKITANILSNKITDLPTRPRRQNTEDFPGFLPPPPRPNFFFAKTDKKGQIIKYSSGITITETELIDLIQATLTASTYRNDITMNQVTFTYLKTPLPGDQGTLLVFNDLSDEEAAMRTLLTNLILVGFFCSLLSFLASFFMAKHAIKPIQYALTQQNKFVSDASHELRTPITIMQTNLDIINSAPLADTIANNRKWLNNLQDETTRMTELINSLLFLARADAKQQLLEKEYFSLNHTILSAVTPFEVIAKTKQITLTTNLIGMFTALGDPARIKQVLTILIDNALRHTPPHGTIIVTCKTVADQLVLTVTDSGEGIASQHLSKLFDRFYQADESRHNGGAGLGLSMAKWIISQHNGSIEVTSTLGVGTIVTIKLPQVTTKYTQKGLQ